MTEQQMQEYAMQLYSAEKQRIQIDPISLQHPQITIDQAYQIQQYWVQRKVADGNGVIGYKIGLTSKVMQRAMAIDQPDYGVLLQDMLLPNNCDIALDDFTDLQVEAELAFFLKKRLYGDAVTVEQVLDATEKIVPALELIAARSYRSHPQTGYRRTVCDTIADNAANAGIILGEQEVSDFRTVDLPWVGAVLSRNDVIEQTGLAAAVLGHPALGICWIAKRFAKHNVGLEPGQILLAGSFIAPIKLAKGDTICADYANYGTIKLQCH